MKKNSLLILILMLISLHMLNAQGMDTARIRSVGENEENSFLDVFPNPSDGTFHIVYGPASTSPPDGWGGILIINITNSNFKVVYTETILDFEGEYSKTIDLHDRGSDVYLIEVVAGKQSHSKRQRVD